MEALRKVVRVGGLGLTKSFELARGGFAKARHRLIAERRLERFACPRLLHVGCGTIHLDGWVNVDAEDLPSVDLVWDLRYGIPGGNGSARMIYCEHFLEHLSAMQGLAFLKECRRVLAPGGILRVAMPSLEVLLEKASSRDWKDQDWLRWPAYQGVKTRAEMLNLAFREWGHQWLYDREELERRLREAGFVDLKFVDAGQSEHAELQSLETRPDSLLVCEATRN